MKLLLRDKQKKNHIDKNGIATPHMKKVANDRWIAARCNIPKSYQVKVPTDNSGGYTLEERVTNSPIDFSTGKTMIEAYNNLVQEFNL